MAERFRTGVIDRSEDQAPTLDFICRVCCDLLPITIASVVLMGDHGVEGITGASDPLAAAIQNEEMTIGEGPATEARRQGRPVLVPDLRDVANDWPQFVRAVEPLGLGAIYAIPLRIGAVDLGVLVFGAAARRALTHQELADCFLVGDLVARWVLDLQAGVTSESLAWALDASDSRTAVHQATGMIAAQLNLGVAEALVRLRANAFATNRPIDQVAAEVVAGRRRFDEL